MVGAFLFGAHMAQLTITIKLSIAWWVWPYVYGVVLMSCITGLEPDMQKVQAMFKRGLRAKVI